MKLLALSLAVFLAAGGGWATSNATQRGSGNESYTMQEERRTQMTAPVFLPNWATEVDIPEEHGTATAVAGGDIIAIGDGGPIIPLHEGSPPPTAVPEQLTEDEMRIDLAAAGFPESEYKKDRSLI